MTATLVLQLPSPPRKNVFREWSGGMGTALDSDRECMGHDAGFYDIPYAAYLYICRRLQQLSVPFVYSDLQARSQLTEGEFDTLLLQYDPRVLVTQVNLPSLAHDLALVGRARCYSRSQSYLRRRHGQMAEDSHA